MREKQELLCGTVAQTRIVLPREEVSVSVVQSGVVSTGQTAVVPRQSESGCWNCHKEGHIAVNCTEPKRCYLCKGGGHLSRYCPRGQCFKCNQFGHQQQDCRSGKGKGKGQGKAGGLDMCLRGQPGNGSRNSSPVGGDSRFSSPSQNHFESPSRNGNWRGGERGNEQHRGPRGLPPLGLDVPRPGGAGGRGSSAY